MSDRDDIGNALFNMWTSYAGACLFALTCALATWLTPRVLRALERLRRPTGTRIEVPTGALIMTTAQEPLPASHSGTYSGLMNPPSPLPQFVNNSGWMQWEAYNRQHDLTTRLAIESANRQLDPRLMYPPAARAMIRSQG